MPEPREQGPLDSAFAKFREQKLVEKLTEKVQHGEPATHEKKPDPLPDEPAFKPIDKARLEELAKQSPEMAKFAAKKANEAASAGFEKEDDRLVFGAPPRAREMAAQALDDAVKAFDEDFQDEGAPPHVVANIGARVAPGLKPAVTAASGEPTAAPIRGDSAPLARKESGPVARDPAPAAKKDSGPVAKKDSGPVAKKDSARIAKSEPAPAAKKDSGRIGKNEPVPAARRDSGRVAKDPGPAPRNPVPAAKAPTPAKPAPRPVRPPEPVSGEERVEVPVISERPKLELSGDLAQDLTAVGSRLAALLGETSQRLLELKVASAEGIDRAITNFEAEARRTREYLERNEALAAECADASRTAGVAISEQEALETEVRERHEALVAGAARVTALRAALSTLEETTSKLETAVDERSQATAQLQSEVDRLAERLAGLERDEKDASAIGERLEESVQRLYDLAQAHKAAITKLKDMKDALTKPA
jgi:hypothetical protein